MAFSAFPNLPGDSGSTIGRGSGMVNGKNLGFSVVPGGNTVIVKDLFETLRKFSKASPQFNKEMRKVAYTIARDLEAKVRIEAGTVSRASQAIQVAKGLRASNERIPTIKLRGKESFVSKSRPNSKRKTKVTRADVFFGAEFGGGATPKTKQFLRHRGQSGYFFWPTVRKRKNAIAKEYLDGMDRVVKELGIG
jgi:DNA mismatch repair ATPase MutL